MCLVDVCHPQSACDTLLHRGVCGNCSIANIRAIHSPSLSSSLSYAVCVWEWYVCLSFSFFSSFTFSHSVACCVCICRNRARNRQIQYDSFRMHDRVYKFNDWTTMCLYTAVHVMQSAVSDREKEMRHLFTKIFSRISSEFFPFFFCYNHTQYGRCFNNITHVPPIQTHISIYSIRMPVHEKCAFNCHVRCTDCKLCP